MQRARLDAEITTASDLCAGTRVMDFLLSSLNFEFEAQDAFKMSRDNLPSQWGILGIPCISKYLEFTSNISSERGPNSLLMRGYQLSIWFKISAIFNRSG